MACMTTHVFRRSSNSRRRRGGMEIYSAPSAERLPSGTQHHFWLSATISGTAVNRCSEMLVVDLCYSPHGSTRRCGAPSWAFSSSYSLLVLRSANKTGLADNQNHRSNPRGPITPRPVLVPTTYPAATFKEIGQATVTGTQDGANVSRLASSEAPSRQSQGCSLQMAIISTKARGVITRRKH